MDYSNVWSSYTGGYPHFKILLQHNYQLLFFVSLQFASLWMLTGIYDHKKQSVHSLCTLCLISLISHIRVKHRKHCSTSLRYTIKYIHGYT